MITDAEIDEAVRLELAKDNKPYTVNVRFWDWILYRFDRRLNDPVWLSNQISLYPEQTIAKCIGCSQQLVHKKLVAYDVISLPDRIFNVHTGFFHYIKRFIPILVKPYIKKIRQGVSSVYSKTNSKNANLFKEIIAELEQLDDDNEDSVAAWGGLNLTRKEAYLLAAKFLVCLYEYDLHYSERIDYVLYRVLEAKERFYFDNQKEPSNWYPHRDMRVSARYMVLRNKK